jgi:hypothetical protein
VPVDTAEMEQDGGGRGGGKAAEEAVPADSRLVVHHAAQPI